MTRNRRQELSDPMDLLLDTVSNVFGGVMFLTLLAALLVVSRGGEALESRAPIPVEDISATVDPSLKMESLELQLNELNFVLESQARTLSSIVPGENIEARISELDQLQRESKAITTQLSNAEIALESEATLKKEAISSQAKLDEVLASLKSQLQQKEVQLEEAEQKSSRKITFSLLHNSDTRDVLLLLRYGKIFRFQAGSLDDVNRDDIEVLDGDRYLPKRSGGVMVTPTVVNEIVMRTEAMYEPDRFHISIFVWDDSFAVFNLLRNALVEKGYKYRTIPCTDDAVIGSNGGDALVQ